MKMGLLGAVIAISLAGCVPIPRDHVEGREIDPNAVTLIKAGITTRQEVIAQLGEPTAIWEQERVLVYSWDRVNWTVIWFIPAGYTGQAGAINIYSKEMLLIQVDETDRVKRAESVVKPMSVSFGEFLRDWANGKIDSKP